MNIKDTFLKLTSRTYPHGTEEQILGLLPDFDKDEFGNLYKQIGEKTSVMFTSHLDTASTTVSIVNHVIEGNIIKTDGKSILGADDKAGVTIMLWMIENNIPGLYYFFLGEERGCIGSKKVADKQRNQKIEGITKVISFDRRGTDSIITYQSGSRCCSDKFATALANEINTNESTFSYRCDPTGIYTDSVQFVKIYPECTNISVGYQNEHRNSESQDIYHLQKLAEACLKVDWENLPVERDIKKDDFEDDNYTFNWSYTKTKEPNKQKKWFFDNEFGKHISYIEIETDSKKITGVDLSAERLKKEKNAIQNFLQEIKLAHSSFSWNGIDLHIEYPLTAGGDISKTNRTELEEYITDLGFWKKLVTHKTNSK